MTPRDRLQRLLFEHRTAHDPASSEREILRMFEALGQLAFVVSTDATQPEFRREHARGLLACDSQEAALQTIVSESERLGLYDERTAHTKEQA